VQVARDAEVNFVSVSRRLPSAGGRQGGPQHAFCPYPGIENPRFSPEVFGVRSIRSPAEKPTEPEPEPEGDSNGGVRFVLDSVVKRVLK